MFGKMKGLFGKDNKEIIILSPLQGTAVPASEINDPTFSEQMLGKTMAIKPIGQRVVSPVSGTINSIFDTGHAASIVSDDGVEIIIHIGLDTVNLQGQHFTIHAKSGDKVKPGDLLIEFDKEAIEKAGYDVITPVIICNSDSFNEIELLTGKDVSELDEIIKITK